MAEEKKPKQRWTADELLVLLSYVQELAPNEKANYAEVVDRLTEEGYERTDKQVQKKFERLRYESKAQNIDIENRLQDLITSMYGDDDEPAEQVKSPKATTPKSKQEDVTEISGKRYQWKVRELTVLLQCLVAGLEKPAQIAAKLPSIDQGKISQKLHNVRCTAREKNITSIELVQQQITRLKGAVEEVEESSEEEKTPVKKGTKRKAEENLPEERSAKKQRAFESPKLNGPKTSDNSVAPDNIEIKKLLNQMSGNNRENFNNLRKFIDGKFEEKRLQDEEQTKDMKKRMKTMEDNMDLMLKEIRSLRSIVTNTSSKSHVPAPVLHTSNKDHSANNNKNQSSDSNPSKQQISYYNFL